MFDQLFKYPAVVAHYCNGPMSKEGIAFLTHLANQGYAWSTLGRTASSLRVIAQAIGSASPAQKPLTLAEVKRKMAKHGSLYPLAIRWLQFVGRVQQAPAPPAPCAKKIKAFANYMDHDRKLSPQTIYSRCWFVTRFLDRLHVTDGCLHSITPCRIDTVLQEMLAPGGYSRKTVQTFTTALRAFFRFAEARGWCRKGLAASIPFPRVFSLASLPLGPSWDDVRRLLAMTEGDEPSNIRARPILMLFAIYGLRAGEVSCLRLDDFDWEHELLRVVASKSRRVRTYPLIRSVGDAILRYLREVRPRSPYREVFLSLKAPLRPTKPGGLWRVVGKRLRSLHISLPHYGPHALRHACATRLLAAGLSLKEIGDQLGHAHPNSTRVYAKVDLAGLRQVADFDMGGVL